MRYFIIFCLSLISLTGTSQSIAGMWGDYNDDTGKLNSEIEITIKDGKLYGRLIKIYDADGVAINPKCTKCTDSRKDQPQVGMEFISGLTQSGEFWIGNKAMLYPEKGKSYDAKLWLVNDNKLAVRGSVGLFYKTKYWKRLEE